MSTMIDHTTRINATIPYFFLGPMILLAKKWTPLAHPFVQGHARRASFIIALGVLSYVLSLLLSPLLSWVILGFSLSKIILMLILSITILFLLMGAYRAYHGMEASQHAHIMAHQSITLEKWEFSEEERMRIIASTIPFFGIVLSEYFPTKEILINRKIANYLTFAVILSLIFFGSNNTVTFFLSGVYIIWCSTVSVMLLLDGKFFSWKPAESLPSYHEFEAHVHTILFLWKEFFRVAFGGKKIWTYQQKYAETLGRITAPLTHTTPFWTHRAIIAIPVMNLITIPSLFRASTAPYKLIISEGLLITFLTILFFFTVSLASPWMYLFLFPIVTLITKSRSTLHVRAPLSSIAVDIVIWMYEIRKKVQQLQSKKQSEHYTYDAMSNESRAENTPSTKKSHNSHHPESIQHTEK